MSLAMRVVRSVSLASLLSVAFVVGCVDDTPADGGQQPTCAHDVDCGEGRYCTSANICRRDCLVDFDCIGLGSGAECNVHGQCIAPVLDVAYPSESGDVSDTAADGPSGNDGALGEASGP
jgi:hypothetical protein